MKARLLTAAIGIPLFLVLLFFFGAPVFNGALSLILGVAVYELLQTAQYGKRKLITVVCVAFGALLPWFELPLLKPYRVLLLFAFAAFLFAALLRWHDTLRTEQVSQIFFVSVVYPIALTTLLYIRDDFGASKALYYTVLIFLCAWMSDAGAYFAGRFFGKRKMAPNISPNKTVEGLIGGILASLISVVLVTFGYSALMSYLGEPVSINYLSLTGASVLATFVGVFGDLTASIMKRQNGIKDYGSIMPGHGGVVDRFDSVVFVAPCFYVWLRFFVI